MNRPRLIPPVVAAAALCVAGSFAVNVRNLRESGSLQPNGAFPDGTSRSDRIVDPRLLILLARFDL